MPMDKVDHKLNFRCNPDLELLVDDLLEVTIPISIPSWEYLFMKTGMGKRMRVGRLMKSTSVMGTMQKTWMRCRRKRKKKKKSVSSRLILVVFVFGLGAWATGNGLWTTVLASGFFGTILECF
jgi:hypothetical protein